MDFTSDLNEITYKTQAAYGGGIANAMVRQPNLQERLDLAVQQAEVKLAAAKEAREIFKRNPDIERLLNIMQSGAF